MESSWHGDYDFISDYQQGLRQSAKNIFREIYMYRQRDFSTS